MQYVAKELFDGEVQNIIGPFPSHCQASSYCEKKQDKRATKRITWTAGIILSPEYMPEKIHG